jgi:hypothetical protein
MVADWQGAASAFSNGPKAGSLTEVGCIGAPISESVLPELFEHFVITITIVWFASLASFLKFVKDCLNVILYFSSNSYLLEIESRPNADRVCDFTSKARAAHASSPGTFIPWDKAPCGHSVLLSRVVDRLAQQPAGPGLPGSIVFILGTPIR